VLLRLSPQILRYEVSVADVPCSGSNSTLPAGYLRAPAWDIFTEAWVHPLTDPMAYVEPVEPEKTALYEDLGRLTSIHHAYRVRETIEIDRHAGVMGRVPGMRNVSGVRFLPHLQPSEALEHWDQHVGPTLTNLKRMEAYVRNVTEAALTAGAPAFPGFGSLSFPTLHDWEHIPFQPDINDFLDLQNMVLIDCTHYRLA
jgi:hypothetical protein